MGNVTSVVGLDVNFQEVVHSIRTGNADVAKPQRFAEDRMDTHKNARLTPKGREEMVRAVVDTPKDLFLLLHSTGILRRKRGLGLSASWSAAKRYPPWRTRASTGLPCI